MLKLVAVTVGLAMLGGLLLCVTPSRIPSAAADDGVPQVTDAQALAAARRTGQPVEVLARRGESREVFAMPGAAGQFMAREHLEPVRTIRDGTWMDIDTRLSRTGESISPKATITDMRFSAGGTAPMVSLTRAGKTMSLTWPDRLPEPVLEGDTAVYRSVLPDVDLRLRADADGFAHVLVVKTPEAAANPELAKLQLVLSSPGMKTQMDAEGNQVMKDAATGGTVFEASTPKMWDSAQPGDYTAQAKRGASGPSAAAEPDPMPVSADLAEAPGNTSRVAPMKVSLAGSTMTLEPDKGLLSDPQTRFPVYLDPKWYTPKSSANLMVASNGWRDYNFTGSMGMGRCPIDLPPAGAYCSESYVKRLFYRIPTSAFVGKEIISAEFAINETWAPSCSGRSVHIYRTTGFGSASTWNSTKDNWADYLTYQDVAKGYNSSCPGGQVRFNVASAVKDASKKGWSYTTFGLKAGHEDDQYGWKKFSSNGYLQVHYNSPPPQPKASQMSLSPGGKCSDHQWGSPALINRLPTLYASNLTDPDAGGVEGEKLSAEIVVRWTDPATGTDKQWKPAGSAIKKNAASGSHRSTFSVQIPAGAVPEKVQLGWDVRAYDGRVWSPWASTGAPSQCYFKYDPQALPAPNITSTDYPELDPDDPDVLPTQGVGRYGNFNIAFDTRVTKYAYAVNTSPTASAAKNKPGAAAVVAVFPNHSGLNQLYISVWDAYNNTTTGVYQFWVTEGAGPRAHFKMDDDNGSTQLSDSAGDPGYPASIGGTIGYQAAGAVGKAIILSGSGYATTSQKVLDTTKSFSVSAWTKLSSKTNTSVVTAQDGAKGSSFALYYSPNYDRWVFNMQDAASDTPTLIRAISASAPPLGQWVHLAAGYDHVSHEIRLYVNGAAPTITSQPNSYPSDGPLQIGRFKYKGGYGTNFHYQGTLDDLRIYDRVVTPDEVNTMSKVRSQVAGLWHLNTQSGSSSPDQSPATVKNPVTLAGAGRVVEDADAAVSPPQGPKGVLALPGGDGDYASVNAPVVNSGESFTISAWVMTPGNPEKSRTVLAMDGANNSAIAVRYDAAKQHYVLDVASADKSDASKITIDHTGYHNGPTGDWDHIAVVYDGFDSEISLWVNGWKEGSEESTSVSYREGVRVFSPATSLQLGRGKLDGSYPSGQNWAGQLDEVWVLRGALDEEQIVMLSDPTEKDDLYT
ncbi:hypothetical protein GEV43_17500 [Actinomadura sp. J1-007]|nr:hypothetical protein [Actinomadura sp. J1-007]